MTNVLIADDEPDICEFVKQELERRGAIHAQVCTEGPRVVARAKLWRPKLILLDITMPEVSGPEIAEALRADPDTTTIPIIFLTCAVTSEETREQDHRIGGQFYVAKPIQFDELLQVMEQALGAPLASASRSR